MRDLLNIVDSLITEAPEDVRGQIGDKIEKIQDESDLKDILKFTNRYTIKKDVFSFTDARKYKEIVSNVLLKALADAEIPEEEVKQFLDKLSKDGIIDEKVLLTARKVHTFDEIVDSEYRKVFNAIKVDVFRDISGKIGELGDVGKGEYLLDIMSPEINRRGAPGDLDVSGTKIELKAGENGRLGPAGSMSLAGRFEREFLPVIQQLVPERAQEQLNPIDFNLKLNMSTFSDFFVEKDKIKQGLTAMLKMHYPSYEVDSIVDTVVDGSGNIDGRKLKEEMLKASFTVYKEEKAFDGIIVMDSEVTKFLYIGSPEDMAASADQILVSFPSWTDTQSNAMKITLAKGRAVSARAAAASAKKQADIAQKIADIDRPLQGLRPKRAEVPMATRDETTREKR